MNPAEAHCQSKFFNLEHANVFEKNTTSSYQHLPTKTLDLSQELSQNSSAIGADLLSLKNLTIEEQEPIHIEPFFNITPRSMPISPHFVFEEEFSSNPWALLIATIFLTKTSGKTARRHMKDFFEQYPTPYHVLEENPTNLERFFHKLGLRKRSQMIWRLTYQFVSSKWRRASDLCGIGRYGEEAYRIFCLGHTDLNPSDRYLKLYLDWLHNHTSFSVENGVEHSDCLIQDITLHYYRFRIQDAVLNQPVYC